MDLAFKQYVEVVSFLALIDDRFAGPELAFNGLRRKTLEQRTRCVGKNPELLKLRHSWCQREARRRGMPAQEEHTIMVAYGRPVVLAA